MTKPLVFNYKDYEELKAENKRLHKENEYLKANLRIEGRKMDIIKQCDVVESCEDCPRYADDCDGDDDYE